MKLLLAKRMLFIGVLLFSAALSAQDATTLYHEGLKLKEAGKAGEALEKFKKALLLKPGYSEALYEMGWCQNDLKDYTGAISSLRKARNVMSAIPKVYFELGFAFEKTTQFDSARICFKRCLELKPDYSGAYRHLGYIAYNAEDHTGALDYFRQYEINWKTPSTDYLYWYQKGFSNNALKQYDSAVAALNKSLEFKKNYTNTWLELGFAYSRLKQNEEAISNYKKAMELDPGSHVPYNGIGEVYRDNIKNMDEAMNWYRKSLEININERKANYGMGYCLNSKNKYAEALPYLRKAIASESTYVAAYVELGYSLFKTGSLPEAVVNLKKAIELNPKNENARYYLVLLYVQQKDKVNAQRYVDELKSLSSKHVTTLQSKVDAL
jgi:tetratricopeptide (TPR) repeat protein